jgi:class 3 adenylate cyclase/tetratricopeptide (TPR) repeat protein
VDLRPFVSKLGAAWVREQPDVLHRMLAGTLVSADLSGFTAMSERLAELGKRGSEELTGAVNAAFTLLISAAFAEDGDVLKFGGDALLVWFSGDDHAHRAIRASAAMQRSLTKPAVRKYGLSMSVGAHSDDFDIFLVGDHRNLVLCGAPVTKVVTLEGAADPSEVLVSPTVARALPKQWLGRRRKGGVLVDIGAVEPSRRRRPDERPEDERPEDVVYERLFVPGLAAQVAALKDAGGEHRLATIGFLELDHTDALLRDSASDSVAARLDALIRAVQAMSARYGVTFLYTDVIADGVKLICSAGAPTSSGDDEESMLRFATELVHGGAPEPLRAGVNCGRVFAGFLGSPERRTYTVMGDPVNLSARLLARTESGQVLASDQTLSRTRSQFELTPVTPFLVKGKSQPVSAQLVGRREGVRSAAAARRTPLVGRRAELEQLGGLVEDATSGAGRAVELVGDAGIGKTRLVEAVSEDSRFDARVRVECQPYDQLVPYAAARVLVRQAMGIDPVVDPRSAGRALRRWLQRRSPDLLPLAPLIALVVGAVVPPTAEVDAIAEEFRPRRTFEVVEALLTQALAGPTLLIIEDVYFIDDASLRLFRQLIRTLGARPWLLLATRRPDGPGVLAGPEVGVLIKLAPLASSDVEQLADSVSGSEVLRAGDLAALLDRSGGNPLFALELVTALSRDGIGIEELPETVERMVATRADRLAPRDRMLLRHAAVAGLTFARAIVEEIFGPVDADAWDNISDFIEPVDDETLRFRHALYRDVAYEGMPFARRRAVHGRLGELLEAADAEAAMLSLHFAEAGEATRCWKYSMLAGEEAITRGAAAEAAACYERSLRLRNRVAGLEPDEVARARSRLSMVLSRLGRLDDALDVVDLAFRQRRLTPTVKAAVALRLAVVRELRGELEQAEATVATGVIVARRAEGQAQLQLAELLTLRGGICYRRGDPAGQLRWAREAAAVAEAAGEDSAQAAALVLVQQAETLLRAGSDQSGRTALEISSRVGDPYREAHALNAIGLDAYYRGDWTVAAEMWERAVERFNRAGDVLGAAMAANNAAEIISDQGHFDEARQAFAGANRAFRSVGAVLGAAVACANEGRAVARGGDPRAGLDLLDDALERFEALGARDFVGETRARRAEAHVLAGASDDARDEALVALDLARDGFAQPTTAPTARRALAYAALQQGDVVESLSHFRAALDEAGAGGLEAEVALALHGMSLAARQTDGVLSRSSADQADEMMERLGIAALPKIPLPR